MENINDANAVDGNDLGNCSDDFLCWKKVMFNKASGLIPFHYAAHADI